MRIADCHRSCAVGQCAPPSSAVALHILVHGVLTQTLRCRFVRRVLEWAGGKGVKIVCKIENEAGLRNYDAILRETGP